MNELFERATWLQFISDETGRYDNCKVLYITDKNIHRIRYEAGQNVYYVVYSETYGRCDFTYSEGVKIQESLSPGIYMFENDELYYYSGAKWTKINTASGSGNNTQSPSVSSFTVWAQHLNYGASGYNSMSDVGHLQISGFVEGRIDGGEW